MTRELTALQREVLDECRRRDLHAVADTSEAAWTEGRRYHVTFTQRREMPFHLVDRHFKANDEVT